MAMAMRSVWDKRREQKGKYNKGKTKGRRQQRRSIHKGTRDNSN
jgi:hypothetical protein